MCFMIWGCFNICVLKGCLVGAYRVFLYCSIYSVLECDRFDRVSSFFCLCSYSGLGLRRVKVKPWFSLYGLRPWVYIPQGLQLPI